MLAILRVLFTPSCWMRIERTSNGWDKFLNDCMDRGEVVTSTHIYTAQISGRTIWIANGYFGYGHEYDSGIGDACSRSTMFRLIKYVDSYKYIEGSK